MIRGGIVGGLYGKGGDGSGGDGSGDGSGGGANPVSYYYGKAQTRRVGQNYTPAGRGTSRAAEFKATADEVHDGGETDLLTILNGSAVSDIDVANAADNCIIQFPAGRYHITFQGYSEDRFATGFRVELRQIQSGTDDIVVTETSGYTGGINPASTEYLLSWPDFVIEGTEQFYFLFPVGGNNKRSHFLRIEKVA